MQGAIARPVAMSLGNQEAPRSIRVRHILSLRFVQYINSTINLPLPLIQEEQLSVNGECTLRTGNLLRGSLPRNSVVSITDRRGMTLAVDRGRTGLTQPTNQVKTMLLSVYFVLICF